MFIKLTSLATGYSTWVNPRHIINFGSLVDSPTLSEEYGEKGTLYSMIDFDSPKLCEETPEEIAELIRKAGVPQKATVTPLTLTADNTGTQQ